jgi:hypothetical protein
MSEQVVLTAEQIDTLYVDRVHDQVLVSIMLADMSETMAQRVDPGLVVATLRHLQAENERLRHTPAAPQPTAELVERVIHALDAFAREYDNDFYGLPTRHEAQMREMRNVVTAAMQESQ